MNSEVAWVLVSSGTQVQPQIILDPEYLPDYLSVSYDYISMMFLVVQLQRRKLELYININNYCFWENSFK